MDIIANDVTLVTQSRIDQVWTTPKMEPSPTVLKKSILTGSASSRGKYPSKIQDKGRLGEDGQRDRLVTWPDLTILSFDHYVG